MQLLVTAKQQGDSVAFKEIDTQHILTARKKEVEKKAGVTREFWHSALLLLIEMKIEYIKTRKGVVK